MAIPKMVLVKVKSVYGRDVIYPACSLSAGFAAIAGCKSLPPAAIKEIRKMGFEVSAESDAEERFLAAIA